jgi:hypothetical protein
MLSKELIAKFGDIGVDIDSAPVFAEALIATFSKLGLTSIQRVAVLRVCEQAIRYDEEENGAAFERQMEKLSKLLAEADRETRADMGD